MDEDVKEPTGLQRIKRGFNALTDAKLSSEWAEINRKNANKMLELYKFTVRARIVGGLKPLTNEEMSQIGIAELDAVKHFFTDAAKEEKQKLEFLDQGYRDIFIGLKEVLHIN